MPQVTRRHPRDQRFITTGAAANTSAPVCQRSAIVDAAADLSDFNVNQNAWISSMLLYRLGLFGMDWDSTPFLDNKASFQRGVNQAVRRTSGWIMLFVIAMDMVFEKRTQRREERAEKLRHTPEVEDVSVFPMAMPMIAGPGSIATIMLLTARAKGTEETLVVLGALIAVMALTLAALAAAGPLMRVLGTRVEAVITRLLGVLLAALAAQYVIDGVKAVLTAT